MAGKLRVHELAKELGVPSSEILARLHEQGENLKSASSTLEAAVVRRVRAQYGTTVAELARTLQLPERVVRDYIRQHAPARASDGVLTPRLADQIRQKFGAVDARASSRNRKGLAGPDATKDLFNQRSSANSRTTREPAYTYIRESTASECHHMDYLGENKDRALCGRQFAASKKPEAVEQMETVCRDCLRRLPEYHEKWWRDRCLVLETELARFQERHRKLEKRLEPLVAYQRKINTKNSSRQQKLAKAQRLDSAVKRAPKVASPKAKSSPTPRVADPEAVRKRLKEMAAPKRPKTAAEKLADDVAAETMRSYKPSSWQRRYRRK